MVPPGVALPQPHPGEPRHQVQLARPAVAQPQRAQRGPVRVERHALVRDRLGDRVVDEELHLHAVLGQRTGGDALVAVELLEVLDEALDDEEPAGLQDRGDVAEAVDLPLLVGQVEEGVEDQVRGVEGAVHRHVGHVADGHRDVGTAGLRAQLLHHGRGAVDALDGDAAGGEGERHAAGADGEFEGAGAGRDEADEEVDGGVGS